MTTTLDVMFYMATMQTVNGQKVLYRVMVQDVTFRMTNSESLTYR